MARARQQGPEQRQEAPNPAAREIAMRYAAERGPLLPILHAVQEHLGYVDRSAVVEIADVLNLSVADVHGVVSFYHDLRTGPGPAHTVAVCRAEACQAVGGQALYEDTERRFASRADVEVAEVFCLGNCALGPSGTMDGRLHGRLTPERVAALTGDWR
ncbi:MAG: NAD(P)H-dependent oxidoreductase subunit E [Dermatophilaceae bacterium]